MFSKDFSSIKNKYELFHPFFARIRSWLCLHFFSFLLNNSLFRRTLSLKIFLLLRQPKPLVVLDDKWRGTLFILVYPLQFLQRNGTVCTSSSVTFCLARFFLYIARKAFWLPQIVKRLFLRVESTQSYVVFFFLII